jgi:hypothetical protein
MFGAAKCSVKKRRGAPARDSALIACGFRLLSVTFGFGIIAVVVASFVIASFIITGFIIAIIVASFIVSIIVAGLIIASLIVGGLIFFAFHRDLFQFCDFFNGYHFIGAFKDFAFLL